jgi:CheY-like chemotaxis protein
MPFILALDDDEDDCYMLTQLLKELFGGRVSLVCTVDEAKFWPHLTAPGPVPDLILLDYHLPPRTARELLPRLKAQAGGESVPIIVWSALASPAEQADCLRLGASEYLPKEVGLLELKAQLYALIIRYIPLLTSTSGN